jgi:hypothetical protein
MYGVDMISVGIWKAGFPISTELNRKIGKSSLVIWCVTIYFNVSLLSFVSYRRCRSLAVVDCCRLSAVVVFVGYVFEISLQSFLSSFCYCKYSHKLFCCHL